MTEIVQPIPARLKNVAVDGHVAGASDIMDDSLNKTQDVINAEVAEAIGTGGSVDSRIAAAINALDSSKSQSAGADGLALNIVEENGKITSISGSIASNTYDAYGAASSEATRAQNAESALGGRVTTLETAVGSGGSVDSRIAAAKAEIKGNATSACDTLGEAETLISAEASRAQAAEQSITTTVTSRLDTQDAEIALLNGAEVIVVEDHTAVSSPDPQKIYREIGTSSYTDWMNQGSGWKAIATYNPGIEDVPTANSNNLVKSGGVYDSITPLEPMTGFTIPFRTHGGFIKLKYTLSKGRVITAFSNGVEEISLFEERGGTATNVSVNSLPYTCTKDFHYLAAYTSPWVEAELTVAPLELANKDIEKYANNCQLIKYLNPTSIFTAFTPEQLQRFVLDFWVDGVKEDTKNWFFGLIHVKSNPTDPAYDTNYCIYVWNTPSATDMFTSVSNLTAISKGYNKPSDGEYSVTIGSHVIHILLDWTYIDSCFETFGTTGLSSGIGTGLSVNQQTLYSKRTYKEKIEINLPDKIYAVVGDTLQLFYRGVIKAVNPYNYDIVVNCNKGNNFPRYFKYTPKLTDVGVTTLTVILKNKDGEIVGEKSCQLQTVASPVSPSATKNVFIFGDSLTDTGIWCNEAHRRLTNNNIFDGITGDGLLNIEFCGGMETTLHDTTTKFFGRGGWTWKSYTEQGSPAIRFYVSNVSSVSVDAVYTNNGHSYTVREVNITAGTGSILCYVSSGSDTPEASGVLIKSSGNGDASISFSSYALDQQNPLWDSVNNKMSFIPYVNSYGSGQCDVVYVLLSWNGQSSWKDYTVDDTTQLSYAKTFLRTLHAEYPNAKAKVMGLQMPSVNGGIGANYGASATGYGDWFGLIHCAMAYNKVLQELCNQAEFSSYCEYVDIASQFDTENNMPYTEARVNIRNNDIEKLGTNGVHPSNPGQYQIGDVVYRNFVANFCQ